MRTYTDSSAIAHDRERLRARLREEGYLYFPGLVDAGAVTQVREGVLSALDGAGWLDPDADPAEARPGGSVRREEADDYWDGYTRIQRTQRFHRLAHDQDLMTVLRALIDDQLVVHPQKIARASFPCTGSPTPPHQDFRYIQGTTDTFTVWMPLGPCPPELGGLRVLGGSQDSGLLPIHSAAGAGGLAVDVDDDHVDWASTDYRAGDVLVFHSLTVHGAIENTTDQLRLSVDYRYQSAADPIAAPSLTPHFFPSVPDWPQLVEGWDPPEQPTVPEGTELVGFGRPASDLRPPPSRFVGQLSTRP